MSAVTQDTRWWCHECSTAFPSPIRNGGNDLPLCPNCMSDVVEERDLGAQDDGWFPAEQEHEDDHHFPGFFNPPSMTGNRQTTRAQDVNPLAEMIRLMSGAIPPSPSSSSANNAPNQQPAPRIHTFTFGNPRGGGFLGGATISIGGGSVLGRDENGFVRDPWEDFRGGRTAAQGGRETFGTAGGGGAGAGDGFAQYQPEPGNYVTIEDLLSHFLRGMTGLGGDAAGPGHMGDYVLSDEGLDQVLEELMHAAGEHNRPPPASEVVIEGLPRIKLDQATLDASQYKNCSICLTEFELGEEVIRIPCKHIFHSGCLVPWLKQNGTCPVCRFSLVPENQRHRPTQFTNAPQTGAPRPANTSGEQGVGGVLNNVFHSISRYFMGGDEHPHDQDHPAAGHNASGTEGSGSHPPGAFPRRPVSPTVEENPDHPISDESSAGRDSHGATSSTPVDQNPTTAASQPSDAPPSSTANPPPPHPSADTSAARFISSFFDQRSSSPSATNGNGARSPGPMGTASYFGRTSSPPVFIRSTSNPPFVPSRDFPTSADEGSQAQAAANQLGSAPTGGGSSDTSGEGLSPRPRDTQSPEQDSAQHQSPPPPSPHPTYPTIIPAEHRERHARQEAMLREAERQREQGREAEGSGEGHTLSEQLNRDYLSPD